MFSATAAGHLCCHGVIMIGQDFVDKFKENEGKRGEAGGEVGGKRVGKQGKTRGGGGQFQFFGPCFAILRFASVGHLCLSVCLP